jgi:hypothetical protein
MSANDEYGRHEALHMASFLAKSVAGELCEHAAVQAVPEWSELADKALDALHDLYQAIGRVHL